MSGIRRGLRQKPLSRPGAAREPSVTRTLERTLPRPGRLLAAGRLAQVMLRHPLLGRDPRQVGDLLARQVGVEEVEDDDEACLVAVVPGRMQERVVEDDAAPLLLFALVVSD